MDIQEASPSRSLTIDIPVNGTIYPPEIIPPQFAWRDDNPAATVWQVEVVFGEKARSIKVWSTGEKMQIGPVDDALVGYVPPTLTPEQAAAHTWRPDPKTWEEIKKHSVNQPATVIVSGYASQKDREPVSRSQAVITTSKDPVGAPIFYRDVPLIPPPPETEQRGVIKPLPDSVLPKIKWQLRYINQPQSKVMMTNLPTCGNCHSFSRDGKTMGIDVDGPANDKGLYALVPVKKVSTISSEYLIHWSAFSEEHAQKRFGFMSQVSPDGKYVVNSIDVPHANGTRVIDRLYNGFYRIMVLARSSIPLAECWPGIAKTVANFRLCPAPTIPTLCRRRHSGAPMGSTFLLAGRSKRSLPSRIRALDVRQRSQGNTDSVRSLQNPFQ